MRWETRIGSLALTLVAAGCLGQLPQDPNQQTGGNDGGTVQQMPKPDGAAQPPTARELFDQNVAPMLAACSSCHAGAGDPGAPVFLGANAAAYYSSLTGNPQFVNNDPTKSLLITHKHVAGNGGIDLTIAQQKFVTDWLVQENVEHVLPPPPAPAQATVAAMELAKFGKCMTQADYDAAGMNDLQNQTTLGDAGECYSCHQTGLYNVYLSKISTDNFTKLKAAPYLLKFADADVAADGTFKDIIPSSRFIDRGQQPGHPGYMLTSARASAVTTFFQSTYTKYKAGNCP
jgi:cytochrome c553